MLRMFRGANKRTKTIWWVLTIVTVVTFLGGFVVLFGLGVDGMGGGGTSVLGTVNGRPISVTEYQAAVNEQREQYRRQYGSEPVDRDAKMVEMQAWRSLVTQRLMNEMARAEGIRVYDPEVVVNLKTSPPASVTASPDLQTDGRFDAAKYQQALQNPNINWAPLEQMVRSQLPTRKLEERLLASIKLSQTELNEAVRDRSERLAATVVVVGPATDVKVEPPGPADLDRAYREHGSRFTSGTRVQLELLRVPRQFSDEDVRSTERQARSLVERARSGEDFAQLAMDNSEGPGAQQGGTINRMVQASEFGEFAPRVDSLPVGGVSDPIPASGRFLIIKVINRFPDPVSSSPSMQIAQIVLRVHGSEEAQRQQLEELTRLRARAARIGLGRAAAEKGLATAKTPPFDLASTPQELYGTPEAADWGLVSKPQAVSPVFEGVDEFLIAQVAERHEAGPARKEELGDVLRQLAEMDARVAAARPRVDQISGALAQGVALEDAAKAAGFAPMTLPSLTRAQPDPRLASAPEVIGALFAAPPGRVIGPLRSLSGWYFARVDGRFAPPDSVAEKMKGEVTSQILQRKQQAFFAGFVSQARDRAKIRDLRAGPR
jgi:peptidyl-prolyl cis-trans isomerase D